MGLAATVLSRCVPRGSPLLSRAGDSFARRRGTNRGSTVQPVILPLVGQDIPNKVTNLYLPVLCDSPCSLGHAAWSDSSAVAGFCATRERARAQSTTLFLVARARPASTYRLASSPELPCRGPQAANIALLASAPCAALLGPARAVPGYLRAHGAARYLATEGLVRRYREEWFRVARRVHREGVGLRSFPAARGGVSPSAHLDVGANFRFYFMNQRARRVESNNQQATPPASNNDLTHRERQRAPRALSVCPGRALVGGGVSRRSPTFPRTPVQRPARTHCHAAHEGCCCCCRGCCCRGCCCQGCESCQGCGQGCGQGCCCCCCGSGCCGCCCCCGGGGGGGGCGCGCCCCCGGGGGGCGCCGGGAAFFPWRPRARGRCAQREGGRPCRAARWSCISATWARHAT